MEPIRERPAAVVCVGGAAIDHSYRALEPLIRDSSNPVRRVTGFGGVARNVAETLARLGVPSALVSALGDDAAGQAIRAHLVACGVDVAGLATQPGAASASYVAVLEPDGALAFGLSDMAVLDALTPARLATAFAARGPAGWIFADCNLSPAAFAALADIAARSQGALAVDAVSVAKAPRLAAVLGRLGLLFLNRDEARALVPPGADATPEALAHALVARGVAAVVLTLGPAGALVATSGRIVHVPAVRAALRDATGAGDALTATTLARLSLGDDLVEAVRAGTLAAALTIEAAGAVREDLDMGLLDASRGRLPQLSWAPP
ncbi:MAG: hypothetical protein JNK67_18215 [Alphaproteobacteria bacterium]|nr:hypothetical protein [Alphaproteobacteria bacterium]